ncbi:MAG TPA: ATP-binding protein [Syntrophorhabdaceae bacterium]|nr:ATP-binding protein [Syntrophorhabdaceae bacterium]HQM80217.1 ATP-binding protein [Syntrophorhabdaceae bacterium]
MRYKKELFIASLIFLTLGILIYLETQLPFFTKFLPVGENKFVIIILNINLLLILLFLFLITRTVVKAYIEKKRGIWGAGLKQKLTSTLLIISIVPSFTLFILATGFFYVSMDKWFSQKIEDTIENALNLTQFHYEDIFNRYEKIGASLAGEIKKRNLLADETGLSAYINGSARTYFLDYLSVHNMSGGIIRVRGSLKEDLDERLSKKIRSAVQGDTVREIIPVEKGELVITGTKVLDGSGKVQALLFVGDTIRVHGSQRIKEIAATHKEFKESRAFKKVLKYSFIIPLFFITILTIFFSMWVGIKIAAEITIPLDRIKEGASIIAKGKFDINLEDRGKDEIGTLVKAFNSMARELQITKDEIEEKRRYIEVILDNVATGIISTDTRGNILFLNRAAKAILGIEREQFVGTPLKDVLGDDFRDLMKSFLKEVKRAEGGSITKEVRLNLKKDITYIRASLTVLTDEAKKTEGFIIAFDDITHIVRAEKLATWREIAKKLTHEIKNPLTPIILSAERIRRKLLAKFTGDEKEVLDETTSVIIRSVDDIKGIVNELTKLTHASQTKTLEDLNAIVEETMGLYKHLYQNITFRYENEEIPPLRVDRDGIKRALINLITNSVKAIEDGQGTITVQTRYSKDKGAGIIEIADTGKGIPDEDKEKVFDPYFTKDKEGLGLGLAIVHSIILEHNGKIRVEDNSPRGARLVIELPIIET